MDSHFGLCPSYLDPRVVRRAALHFLDQIMTARKGPDPLIVQSGTLSFDPSGKAVYRVWQGGIAYVPPPAASSVALEDRGGDRETVLISELLIAMMWHAAVWLESSSDGVNLLEPLQVATIWRRYFANQMRTTVGVCVEDVKPLIDRLSGVHVRKNITWAHYVIQDWSSTRRLSQGENNYQA